MSSEHQQQDYLLISYFLEKKLVGKTFERKQFCKKLLDHHKVDEIFASCEKFDKPVLEVVSYFFANSHPEDPLELINNILVDCKLAGLILTKDELTKVSIQGNPEEHDILQEPVRAEIFQKIAKCAAFEARDIAHFLINYNKFKEIEINNPKNVRQRLLAVLNYWYKEYAGTWTQLKAVLNFLKKKHLIKEIEQINIEQNTSQVNDANNSPDNISDEGLLHDLNPTIIKENTMTVITYTANENVYKGLLTGALGGCSPEKVELVLSGGTKPSKIEFEEYSKRCLEFLSMFFRVHTNIIHGEFQFPTINVSDDDKVSQFATKFQMDDTVVITNYDLMEQLQFFGKDKFPDSINIKSLADSNDRFLVFSLELGCTFNVRYTETTDEKEALKVLIDGDKDLRLLLYTFRDQFMDTHHSFINCVAAPNIATPCGSYLILTEEVFSPDCSLKDELKELYNKSKDHNYTTEDESRNEESKRKLTRCISIIVGFLTTIRLSLVFPDIGKHSEFLWLTYEQWNTVVSKHFWKIIQGGYGSGKTVVARSLVKRIILKANIPTDIYFLIFDSNSLLRKDTMDCLDNIKARCKGIDVNITCGNLKDFAKILSEELKTTCHRLSGTGDVKLTISNILKALICKYPTEENRVFHLIIDEVDAEFFSNTEVLEISNVLTSNKEMLKHSHIVFLLRAMEKHRTCLSNELEVPYTAFRRYEILKKHMQITQLNTSMRTSENVYNVIKVAIEAIKGPNVLLQEDTKPLEHLKEDKKVTVTQEIPNISSSGHETDINAVTTRTATNKLLADQKTTKDNHIVITDLDHIDNAGKELEEKHFGSKSRIETTFIYKGYERCGHNIPTGNKTKLIFLNPDDSQVLTETNVAKLSICLDQNCFKTKSPVRRLITCNTAAECSLFHNVMKVLRKPFMMYHPKQDEESHHELDKYSKKNITVITDYSGCRGQEYEEVIVVLDPTEHYKRQYIIESMSRCVGNLILIVPYPYKQHESIPSNSSCIKDVIFKLERRTDLTDIISYTVNENSNDFLKENSFADRIQIDINKKHIRYDKFILKNDLEEVLFSPKQEQILSIGKRRAVTDIKCSSMSSKKIKLSWNAKATSFIVRKRLISGNQEKENVFNVNVPECELEVEENCKYNLEIRALSDIGDLESEPANITFPLSLVHDSNPNECIINGRKYTFEARTHSKTRNRLSCLIEKKDFYVFDIEQLIINNDVHTMRQLLQLDSTFLNTMSDDSGRAPLMWAVIYNKLSMVELFIAHGVDVTWCDVNGNNVIHLCAQLGHDETLSSLLNICDDKVLNKRTHENRTPLWNASFKGHIECVRLLLQQNVDVDVCDKDERTAFDVACQYDNQHNRVEILRQLLLADYKKETSANDELYFDPSPLDSYLYTSSNS